MIKKETIIKQQVVNIRYCDECKSKISDCSHIYCEICGKDLCNGCVEHEEYSFGDSRTVYCKDCWNIGEVYRNKITELETKIDNLTDEYHKKCKDKRKQNGI